MDGRLQPLCINRSAAGDSIGAIRIILQNCTFLQCQAASAGNLDQRSRRRPVLSVDRDVGKRYIRLLSGNIEQRPAEGGVGGVGGVPGEPNWSAFLITAPVIGIRFLHRRRKVGGQADRI